MHPRQKHKRRASTASGRAGSNQPTAGGTPTGEEAHERRNKTKQRSTTKSQPRDNRCGRSPMCNPKVRSRMFECLGCQSALHRKRFVSPAKEVQSLGHKVNAVSIKHGFAMRWKCAWHIQPTPLMTQQSDITLYTCAIPFWCCPGIRDIAYPPRKCHEHVRGSPSRHLR